MNEELFKHTFNKYFGEHLAELYLPKIQKAALYRTIIYYLQMSADASNIIISSVEIVESKPNQYWITVNKTILINYSMVVKAPPLETTVTKNY